MKTRNSYANRDAINMWNWNVISIFTCNQMKYFWPYRSGKFRDERFGMTVPRAAKLFLDSMGFSQFRRMTKIDVLHLVGTGKRALGSLGNVPRCRRIFPRVTDCRQRLSQRVSPFRPLLCYGQSNLFRAVSYLSIEFRRTFVKKNGQPDTGNP